MGLLEKANIQKSKQIKPEEKQKELVEKSLEPIETPQGTGLLSKSMQSKQTKVSVKPADSVEIPQGTGLLSKAISITQPKLTKKPASTLKSFSEPHDVIEEEIGFGWNGLGIRRIIQNKKTSEYLYEIIEPELNEQEIEIKKELTHLFKMLADVNVSGSTLKKS
jgi:hypothetical protein